MFKIVHKEGKKSYAVSMWILLFALLAPFTPFLDLYFSGLFYSPESGFYNNAFFAFLFKYGELFGLATGVVALVVFILSFFSQRWKKWRRGALAVGLTLFIGAGLITNLGFKEYWGRPRPKQEVEFGGKHEYRPFWRPDFNTRNDPQRSFPSGHVSMGFYFLSVWLVGKRYNTPLLKNTGLFLVIVLGGGLMVARVVQGGHFFSDVIASAILMWYVAKGVDWLVFQSKFTSEGWVGRLLGSSIPDTSQVPEKH
ncbi:phosphatase PAP2 family protein [Chlamydiota bacterium]